MPTYTIWSEGYNCTGESAPAQFHGKVTANSFEDACKKRFANDAYFKAEGLSYWICKLFDNEADARRSFG